MGFRIFLQEEYSMRNRILAALAALMMLLSLIPAAVATTVEVTAVTGSATAKGFGGDVTVMITWK